MPLTRGNIHACVQSRAANFFCETTDVHHRPLSRKPNCNWLLKNPLWQITKEFKYNNYTHRAEQEKRVSEKMHNLTALILPLSVTCSEGDTFFEVLFAKVTELSRSTSPSSWMLSAHTGKIREGWFFFFLWQSMKLEIHLNRFYLTAGHK